VPAGTHLIVIQLKRLWHTCVIHLYRVKGKDDGFGKQQKVQFTSQQLASAPPWQPQRKFNSLLEIVSKNAPSGLSLYCQTTSMPM